MAGHYKLCSNVCVHLYVKFCISILQLKVLMCGILFVFLLFCSIWSTLLTRAGLHPLDLEVGKWLRKHAPQIKPIVVMNKSESLFDSSGSLTAAANEMYRLGFGDPIAISAETGLGMHDLYLSLRPVLENYMLHVLNGK